MAGMEESRVVSMSRPTGTMEKTIFSKWIVFFFAVILSGAAPTPKQVNWESLIPVIRTVIEGNFLDERIELNEPLRISEESDITGDGIPEALVYLGMDGAYTWHFALMRLENDKPLAARFKRKDGKISPIIFLDGASVMNGEKVVMLPDKNAIYAGHWSKVNRREAAFRGGLTEYGVEAYQWDPQTKTFDFSPRLSDEIKAGLVREVEGCSEPRQNRRKNGTSGVYSKEKGFYWKGYHSDTMKFSMNYPSNWTVGAETALSTGTGIEFCGKEGEKVNIKYGRHYSQDLMRDYTLQEWINSGRKWFRKYHPRVEEKNIRLGGADAVDFIYEDNGRIAHDIYCGKDDRIYEIEISSDPSRNDFIPNGSRFMLATLTTDAIRTGKVKIDIDEIKIIQKLVDEGHQPWQINPLMAAMSQICIYGFDPNDPMPGWQKVDQEHAEGKVSFEVTHMGKAYIVTLAQPVRGAGKVWTISEVEEKAERKR
jgi:hypothetical protein